MTRHKLRLVAKGSGAHRPLSAGDAEDSATEAQHSPVKEGTFLITHPVACLQQPTLSHALIFITNCEGVGSAPSAGWEDEGGDELSLVQGVVVNKPMGHTLGEIVLEGKRLKVKTKVTELLLQAVQAAAAKGKGVPGISGKVLYEQAGSPTTSNQALYSAVFAAIAIFVCIGAVGVGMYLLD